jgi:stage II sporulation protein D
MNVWQKDLPYLKGVDCPFDASSPYYEWRNAFSVERLEATLRQEGYRVGTIASLTPFWYSRAGRVMRVRILHSGGELILRGQDLRRIIGYSVVPSTLFQVDTFGRDIVLSGRGNGHAVGLCQWGAKELAERGYPYAAILNYYFPGTDLTRAAALPLP